MKRRRRILWKKIFAYLSAWTLIISGGYLYLRTGFFTIHTYEIEGAPEAYVDSLRTNMEILADQKLYKTLPGNRIISYHRDDIRILIEETLPNTSTIHMYPKGLHTLRVSLESHTPLFSVSDTHAITEDGIIYKEIIPLTDYPRLHVASTTEVTRKTFVSLSKLTKNLSSVLFPVEYIDIDSYDDIRLYDKERKSAVIVTSSGDMDKVWSNVLSAIDTEPLKSKLAGKGEYLEYIDTRFGNKVFYKFTNGESPIIIPSDNATTTSQTAQ